MLIAQATTAAQNIAPEILGWGVILSLLTLSTLALNVMNLVRSNQRQKREVTISDQFVTHGVCSVAHQEISHRLTRSEANIGEIWKTMRQENETIRDEMRKSFSAVERALGRIEGQLQQLTNRDA
jgi:hypothetical protein